MIEYYRIGSVGRGEVPPVNDPDLEALDRDIQALADARRWAAAWKAEAKHQREYRLSTRDVLDTLADRFDKLKSELTNRIKMMNQMGIEIADCHIKLLTLADERTALELDVKKMMAELAAKDEEIEGWMLQVQAAKEALERRCTTCRYHREYRTRRGTYFCTTDANCCAPNGFRLWEPK